MKLPKEFRGKYVTRSAFAKMQAEKHRLERDIRIMVTGSIPEIIFVKEKYRKQYDFWDDIVTVLKTIAKKELPEKKLKNEVK